MDIYIKDFYISIIFLSVCTLLSGQVTLDNSSMEGTPADATMPSGWFSAAEGTTPDILPGYWGVYNEPFDGETYIGIITRQDGSFESISQRLNDKLIKDACYNMSIHLAHSDNYTGYNQPIHLRVWLGSKKNERAQLIFKSPKITHLDWKNYDIEFNPNDDMYYIIIEAHISDNHIPHKGNILIDKISPILRCNRV